MDTQLQAIEPTAKVLAHSFVAVLVILYGTEIFGKDKR